MNAASNATRHAHPRKGVVHTHWDKSDPNVRVYVKVKRIAQKPTVNIYTAEVIFEDYDPFREHNKPSKVIASLAFNTLRAKPFKPQLMSAVGKIIDKAVREHAKEQSAA